MLPLRHVWSDSDRAWALAYCQETAEALADYLTSDSLFVTLGLTYEGGLARGSIGGFLEYQARLEADDLTAEERDLLTDSVTQFDSARRLYAEGFQRKVEKELRSLLNTWAWYLDECDEDRHRCAQEYANQVWRRSRIHALQNAAPALPAQLSKRLDSLDQRLRRFFRAGDFVWDEGVRKYYAEEECWWLFRQI